MIIESPKGYLDVPPETFQVIAAHAERTAMLTARAIDELNKSTKVPELPVAALLELGALAQIGFWEHQGVFTNATIGLPSFREAETSLIARIRESPKRFGDIEAAELSEQVLRVQIEYLSGSSFPNSEAMCCLMSVDDEMFVNRIAEFLWRYRHDIVRAG